MCARGAAAADATTSPRPGHWGPWSRTEATLGPLLLHRGSDRVQGASESRQRVGMDPGDTPISETGNRGAANPALLRELAQAHSSIGQGPYRSCNLGRVDGCPVREHAPPSRLVASCGVASLHTTKIITVPRAVTAAATTSQIPRRRAMRRLRECPLPHPPARSRFPHRCTALSRALLHAARLRCCHSPDAGHRLVDREASDRVVPPAGEFSFHASQKRRRLMERAPATRAAARAKAQCGAVCHILMRLPHTGDLHRSENRRRGV
jgi:hypothetical protein